MPTELKPETILFCSRGRGRGHAVADVAIADELKRLRPQAEVRFASYATGADTIEQLGHEVLDLDLPADNPVLETLVRVGHTIGWLRPTLVVAHEEFMALPASKIFQIPNAAITDWFPEERHFVTQTLLYADEILFTDEPGIFEEPPALKGRIHYIGPAIREFKYGPKDKQQARQELGVEANAKVVTVLPGSWTEAKTPVFDLVTSAFRSLPLPNKNLIWIAGQDYDLLTSRAKQNPENLSHTKIKQQDWQIDRLMVASDLVLTKASRETHKELNALRVQSISLSFGLNSPDDKRAEKFRRNTALDARGLTPEALSQVIHQQLNNPLDPPQSEPSNNGRQQAASRLATRLHEIRAHGL